jgi:hypothetical protein
MLYLSPIPKYSDPLPLWTTAAESQNAIPSFEYVVARTLRGFVLGPLSITGRFAASQQPLAATWNFICRCEDASRLVPTTAKRACGQQSPLRWVTLNNRTLRGFATCARNDMEIHSSLVYKFEMPALTDRIPCYIRTHCERITWHIQIIYTGSAWYWATLPGVVPCSG